MDLSPPYPKFPKEKYKKALKRFEEGLRSSSACTKSTSSSKNSPTPDHEIFIGPLLNSVVNEHSCDSEVSAIEDPAPLLINYLNSKDILTGIKADRKNIHFPGKTLKKNLSYQGLKENIIRKRSVTLAYEKIKDLQVQISDLTQRATFCESELKIKELENYELKSLVSSLQDVVELKKVEVDQTSDSVCKSCDII